MLTSLQTALLGKRVETKPRGNESSSWFDDRDNGRDPIIGEVITVVAGQDGIAVLHIRTDDGWIHTRSTVAHLYRVVAHGHCPGVPGGFGDEE